MQRARDLFFVPSPQAHTRKTVGEIVFFHWRDLSKTRISKSWRMKTEIPKGEVWKAGQGIIAGKHKLELNGCENLMVGS